MLKIKQTLSFLLKTCFTLLIVGFLTYGGVTGATFLGYLPDKNYSSNLATAGAVMLQTDEQESAIEISYNPELPEELQEKDSQTQKNEETEPKEEKPKDVHYSFVAVGDSEDWKAPNGYNQVLIDTLNQVERMTPAFVVLTGDIINSSGQSLKTIQNRVTGIKDLFEKYTNQFFLTFGYHDLECGKYCAEIWQKYFFGNENIDDEINLYFSTDYENTKLIFLSTDFPNQKSINTKQFEWLENTLKNTDKKHKIVFMHVPPVNFFEKSAKDCYDFSCNQKISERLMSFFRIYNVDLVVAGHEGVFDHKIVDGIDIVLSGNPTGKDPAHKNVIHGRIITQFTVDNDDINLKAINIDKDEIMREIKIK